MCWVLSSIPISPTTAILYMVPTSLSSLQMTPRHGHRTHQEQELISLHQEVDRLAAWCTDNNLLLNTKKTKELIVDLRKEKGGAHTPIHINREVVDCVTSFKFQGIHISSDLTWTTNSYYIYTFNIYYSNSIYTGVNAMTIYNVYIHTHTYIYYKYYVCMYVYIYIYTHTYTYNIFIYIYSFSKCFYPKRLTNEDNGSNQNQQKSNDMLVL